jgi:hypothetical protein
MLGVGNLKENTIYNLHITFYIRSTWNYLELFRFSESDGSGGWMVDFENFREFEKSETSFD